MAIETQHVRKLQRRTDGAESAELGGDELQGRVGGLLGSLNKVELQEQCRAVDS